MNWYYTKIKTAQATLPKTYIYDPFAILLLQTKNMSLDTFQKHIIDERMQVIKNHIIDIFEGMMRDQIQKYLSRPDRYDPKQIDFLKTYPTATSEDFSKMFGEYTFRSQRARNEDPELLHNDNWKNVANQISKLKKINDGFQIAQVLGEQSGLYNLVHNTYTTVLDKMSNGKELLQALNDCNSRLNTIRNYIPYVSKDIKEVLKDFVYA